MSSQDFYQIQTRLPKLKNRSANSVLSQELLGQQATEIRNLQVLVLIIETTKADQVAIAIGALIN